MPNVAMIVCMVLFGFSPGWSNDDATVDYQTVVWNIDAAMGMSVEWFGTIDLVTPQNAGDMEIALTQIPLDRHGIPLAPKHSQGRFIVRVLAPLSPFAYTTGIMVSVQGTVAGGQARELGNAELTWPVIRATKVCIWERALPKAPKYCRVDTLSTGSHEIVNNDANAVSCDDNGYQWVQTRSCDVAVSKDTRGAGNIAPKALRSAK